MAKNSRNRKQSPKANAQQPNRTESTPSRRAESRRAQRVVRERQAKRKRIYTMFGGAAAAALLLALILVLINMDDSGRYSDEPVAMPPPMSAEIVRDGMTLGDPNAPVQIIEYGDYQCPGCASFARSVKPQLMNDYIANGLVYFESRELTGLGPESRDASIGALCALEQGMYWEFYDMLYYNQVGRNDGGFSEQRMTRMAEQLEMDVDAFEDCLGTNRFNDRLDEMTDQAQSDGVRATPSVIVNGVLLEGPNYEQLRQQVEVALQQAGS